MLHKDTVGKASIKERADCETAPGRAASHMTHLCSPLVCSKVQIEQAHVCGPDKRTTKRHRPTDFRNIRAPVGRSLLHSGAKNECCVHRRGRYGQRSRVWREFGPCSSFSVIK